MLGEGEMRKRGMTLEFARNFSYKSFNVWVTFTRTWESLRMIMINWQFTECLRFKCFHCRFTRVSRVCTKIHHYHHPTHRSNVDGLWKLLQTSCHYRDNINDYNGCLHLIFTIATNKVTTMKTTILGKTTGCPKKISSLGM